MREILDDLDRWRAAGTRVALARVVDIEGSGPRGPGAAMAVNEDGEVAGCVAAAASRAPSSPRRWRSSAGDGRAAASSRSATATTRRSPSASRAAARSTCSSSRSTGERRRRSTSSCATASAPSEPVALATVIDGPAPRRQAAGRARRRPPLGHARRPRPRPGRRPRRAGRAGGRPAPACATTGRRARRRRGPRGLADLRVFVESLRPAAADVDLRRRRLHGRAGPGGQGARLPRHGVRRPRDLRHPAPVPDGRRGRRVVAGTAVRAPRRRRSARATPCAC